MSQKIKEWLGKTNQLYFTLYATLSAFVVYFCMYAYRKPFTVAKFEGQVSVALLGLIDYKIILIISQVIGYTLSKFLGVKLVSESNYEERGKKIILMLIIALFALLGFAITPRPYNFIFMFINGLPLGMIWGLVFGFLEGRKTSDFMGAGLSASFIISSGVVKSVGKILLDNGVSEIWMPFLSGLIFFPLLLLSVYLLQQLPAPSKEDEALKTKRLPMNSLERKKFFVSYYLGLAPLIFLYMVLTAFRDFRDNFAREIWDSLGYSAGPEIFSLSEMPIGFVVLIILGALVLFKDPKKTFTFMFSIMITGAGMISLSTFLFQTHVIGPLPWMILIGIGLYFCYVPFGCMLFDNIMALVGTVGTAGFMIYVADAFGYLGSVFLMLYKNFFAAKLPWLTFFISFSYATAFICTVGLIFAYFYFQKKSI